MKQKLLIAMNRHERSIFFRQNDFWLTQLIANRWLIAAVAENTLWIVWEAGELASGSLEPFESAQLPNSMHPLNTHAPVNLTTKGRLSLLHTVACPLARYLAKLLICTNHTRHNIMRYCVELVCCCSRAPFNLSDTYVIRLHLTFRLSIWKAKSTYN